MEETGKSWRNGGQTREQRSHLRRRRRVCPRTFLNAVTEPLLRPIRRLLPNLGGVDVSPIILILLIMFLQRLLGEYFPGFRY